MCVALARWFAGSLVRWQLLNAISLSITLWFYCPLLFFLPLTHYVVVGCFCCFIVIVLFVAAALVALICVRVMRATLQLNIFAIISELMDMKACEKLERAFLHVIDTPALGFRVSNSLQIICRSALDQIENSYSLSLSLSVNR